MLVALTYTPFSPRLARGKSWRDTLQKSFPRDLGGMVGFFIYLLVAIAKSAGKGARPWLFILFISFYVRLSVRQGGDYLIFL